MFMFCCCRLKEGCIVGILSLRMIGLNIMSKKKLCLKLYFSLELKCRMVVKYESKIKIRSLLMSFIKLIRYWIVERLVKVVGMRMMIGGVMKRRVFL